MVFRSAPVHLLSIVLLVFSGVFAYDSAVKGLWAGFALACAVCVVLLGIVWNNLLAKPPPGAEPVEPQAGDDLRAVLDQLPIPLVRHQDGSPPQALNRAARGLFRTDDVILPEADALVGAIDAAAGGWKTVIPVLGRQYTVNVSEVASGQGYARLATLTDVQMEMHKAEAAALRDTLQVLSHEIMNSLTPVSSLAGIAAGYLADDPPDVAPAQEALDLLSRRAGSLARFIEAYRSIARLPEPVPQRVEPARLVRDVVGLFAHMPANRDVVFKIDADGDMPWLDLDESQISQAVINVVTNAIEATEGADSREVAVSVRTLHNDVVISVSDNGPGVPDSIRSNLFTAFATTKPGGTGTGLNLARQIALAHGGNLRLVDDGQAGPTTFAFIFPVHI